jgi:beta-lactamase regulating signal transducer with metallopeptidase domain
MDTAGFIFGLLIETNIKVVIVLLSVCMLLVACRHKSSAYRFTLLSVGLLSLLLIPILVATLPRISIPLYLEMKSPLQNVLEAEAGGVAMAKEAAGISGITEFRSLSLQSPHLRTEVGLGEIVASIWLIVSAVLLARLTVGTARLRKLVSRARPVTCARLVDLIFNLKNEIGIRRPVEVRMVGADITPLTVGIIKPRILMPEQSLLWSEETCKAVLLHELHHIKRFDYLQHVLVNIIQAVYWINPFVLGCAGKFHAEQEVTCDDQVILNGVQSKAYARYVLSIAMTVVSPKFGLPFWNGTTDRLELERRVLSILNTGKNRTPLHARSLAWTLLMCMLFILPLSALKFTEFSPQDKGTKSLMQGYWVKLEEGGRLLLSDDCRLLIDGIALFQEGWKDTSLEFPSGSSFRSGIGKLAVGYLGEQCSEIVVFGNGGEPEWRLRFEPECRRVVLKKEAGAQRTRLECVNQEIIPDCSYGESSAGKIETYVKVDIRNREQIFSNRLGMSFVILALREDAPENHSGTGSFDRYR